MGYIELPKLYYIDEQRYYSEYRDRFNAPDTVRLKFDIKKSQAFFVRDVEISGLVFQILRLDKSISLLSNKLPEAAHEQFRKRCLIDEITLTNKIEGVHSTRREIASILNELEYAVKEKSTRKRFWGLVNQYYILKAKEHAPLNNSEDIRRLYDDLVLAEVIYEDPDNAPDGKLFRKESVSVHTVTEREIHRGSYPESAIHTQLEAALTILNDESIELLYRIAVFHYFLGYIHPFYDGNGRLGRFIVSDFLSKELNPLLAYCFSSTIMENINLYYNAFKICNDPRNLGDVTPFLIMMLNMIKTASLQLEETLQSGYMRLISYEKSIALFPGGTKERTSVVYNALLQASLFSENGITTRELEKLLGNSFVTIKKELDFIYLQNLLIRNKIGREYFYILDLEKLDAMLSI
jgi:Fic family protein